MKVKLEEIISEYIKDYMKRDDVETRWKEPVLRYADANDEMFYELKKIVSPTHGLPTDF